MGPYMSRSLGCYKCPADNYASYLGVRNRTVGMNSFVGDYIGLMVGKFGNTGYRVYNKLGDFTRPGPSITFVLLDECPDSRTPDIGVTPNVRFLPQDAFRIA